MNQEIELATIHNTNNTNNPVLDQGFTESLIESKDPKSLTSSINKNLCPTIYFYGQRMMNEKLFIPSQFPNLTKHNIKTKIETETTTKGKEKKVSFKEDTNKNNEKIKNKRDKNKKDKNKENKKYTIKKTLTNNKTRKRRL
jgi:hypothetical protein